MKLALLHNLGLNREEMALFEDLSRLFWKQKPRNFKDQMEVINRLVTLVVEEVKREKHDYPRHLEEARDRIESELDARRVKGRFRTEIISVVFERCSKELEV